MSSSCSRCLNSANGKGDVFSPALATCTGLVDMTAHAACNWLLLWSILSREIHLLLYWVWVAVGGCSRMLKELAIQRVYGDKDADGFYSGETGGRFGFVPSNMVSEIPVEDGELKLRLFQQGYLPEETPSIAPSETSSVPDGAKVHRMVAIFDYDPWESSPNVDIEDELPFRAGDIIYVFGEMDSDGFYYGDLHGYRGLVPSNFLQPLPWD
ncbi:RIMS-binding protein 2-like isoform X1 [Megalobrama amblycephala]|uniref:RIMS-binding protein 2-like isoform X1 n=1 Tax=Megalobrama amblycephala TaxID=75352 RepID=UPI0020142765|nr:RIMS-binding protein 2-like isoform X1 [Megalobrama amblycephala]